MASISIRKSIRWLPEPASEPTSTLVLTSPGRRFVDIRVLLPTTTSTEPTEASKETAPPQPLSNLDWAFGGTSSSAPLPHQPGSHRSVWTHLVDSRTALDPATRVRDEADMTPQADGTALEAGRTAHPATGREAAYEEVWADAPVPAGAACVVLERRGDAGGVEGMVVRLGPHCQGVVRRGATEAFAAERWRGGGVRTRWEERGGEAGAEEEEEEEEDRELWMPCLPATQHGEPGRARLAVGDEVGRGWVVVEQADEI
ncbi:hypothetical protein F4780DRAFT_797552 [Xylariomycetidae sp. FL0641]|nr:hypothetical protein F4780DRAFT_797552 [Xylariomycetidae sp. FL0641]